MVTQVSEAFKEALDSRTSHFISYARVLYNRQPLRDNLAIVSGTVTQDRGRIARGSATLRLHEPTLIPTQQGGILSPTGYEIQIYRGFVFEVGTEGVPTGAFVLDDGTVVTGQPSPPVGTYGQVEAVSLGVFPIQRSNIDGRWLATDLDLVDRMQFLIDDLLEADYDASSALSIEAHAEWIVDHTVLSGIEREINTTTPHAGALYEMQTARASVLEKLATAAACETYFDGDGQWIWRKASILTTEVPVDWHLRDGEGGNVIDPSIVLDRGPSVNYVKAFGNNPDTEADYVGIAIDLGTTSLTRYDGPSGKKQRFFSSPLFTSNDMAQATAETILGNYLGISRVLDITIKPNPAMNAGDVVEIHRADAGLTGERAIIDQVSIGLTSNDVSQVVVRSHQEMT
jgi:hypothetical protein